MIRKEMLQSENKTNLVRVGKKKISTWLDNINISKFLTVNRFFRKLFEFYFSPW